jgi:fibronectin type 3 domain-containing protein
MYHGDPYNGDITVSDATSWAYAGTGLANGSAFPGLLGYETNAVFDNGHSPQGLRTLADSYDLWGGSQLTTYTAPSRSITFATGSMQWNWGLDDYGNPCGAPCVSAAAQQVARNVLARFVQPFPPLATPQNVQATAGNAQIDVTWSATSDATAYNVYRSTVAGGEGSTPYRSGITSFAFTDTGLTNGTKYYYQVSGTNGPSQSALSSEVSATPSGTITSQWTFCASEDGTCTFQGTRRVRYGAPGQYSILTKTSPVPCNNATFGDPAVGADKTCEYETVSIAPTLAAPQNVQATAGDAQVNLSWSATSGATAYNVYRSTVAGGEGTTPYRSGLTSPSFTDTGLINGTRYYYRVSATDGTSESALSSEVSAVPNLASPTGLAPVPPSGLRYSIAGRNVRLSWTQSTSSAITGNNVYRSTSASGPFTTPIAKLSATTSYNDNGGTSGVTYYYVVTAVNANGESAFSNMIQVRK